MPYGHMTAPQARITEDGTFADANTARSQKAIARDQRRNAPRAGCECGCGGYPNKPTSRYLPGHDGRHKGVLLGKAYAGDEAALALLIRKGWGHFFVPAKAKRS